MGVVFFFVSLVLFQTMSEKKEYRYKQSFFRTNIESFVLLTIVLGIVLVYLGYRFIPTFGNYSEGERVGILQKFSHKGYLIKTWEGEMAMEGIRVRSGDNSTTASSVFSFSVLNDSVVKILKDHVGSKLRVHYHETIHTSWADGSTNYFIDKVEVLSTP